MYVEDNKMIASVCGVVERVNKLISVRPYKSRYVPKIGDVVIGRVTDVFIVSSSNPLVECQRMEDGCWWLSGCIFRN